MMAQHADDDNCRKQPTHSTSQCSSF